MSYCMKCEEGAFADGRFACSGCMKAAEARIAELESAISRAKAQFPYLEKLLALKPGETYDRLQVRGIIDALAAIECPCVSPSPPERQPR